MEKIWNFVDDISHNDDVSKLLAQYATSLNKQQSSIEAIVDIGIDYSGQAVFKLYVGYIQSNGTGYSPKSSDIFTIKVKFNGNVELTIHYYDRNETSEISFDKLETTLDSVIKSEEMGSLINYIIRISKLIK